MPIKLYFRSRLALTAIVLFFANIVHAQTSCDWLLSTPYSSPLPAYNNACATLTCPSCTWQPAIQKVWTTGGIQNLNNGIAPSTNSGCTSGGYAFYDNTTPAGEVKANAGSSVTLNVALSNPGTAFGRLIVYVDWNHDGHFETGDQIPMTSSASLISNTNFNPVPVTIAIPATAQNGLTRMRVRVVAYMAGNAPGFSSPCGLIDAGETEDYMFEVVNPCREPAVISISNVSCNAADIAWSTRSNATFYDVWVDTILAPWSRTDAPDCGAGSPWCSVTPCYCKWWHQFGPTQTSTSLPGPVNTNLVPEKKYYVCIRSVCDTFQKPLFWTWDTSANWAIDSFTTLPCCNAPDVICTGHTATSLSFAWGPVHTANYYEYVLSTQNGLNPITGTVIGGNSITIGGLSSSRTYYFYLRSRCSPTPLSAWTEAWCATDNTLDVNNLQGITELMVYPNPAKDIVTIEAVGSVVKGAILTITDLKGAIVFSSTMNDAKMNINTGTWAKGIYIIKFADEASNKVIKITKE